LRAEQRQAQRAGRGHEVEDQIREIKDGLQGDTEGAGSSASSDGSGVTCKGCGRPLVTKWSSERCVFCGKRARPWRVAGGKRVFTRRGVARARAEDAIEASRLTWQEAEVLARDWMKVNGYRDATLTGPGADGGIDVSSRRGIA
jgi:hypothetical protein